MNMMTSFVRPLAAVTLLFALFTGCQSKPGTSILGTTINGRQITAEVSGGAFIQSQGNEAIISTSKHKIIVASEHVSLDGKEVAKLPADAKKVEVTVKDGQLTVKGDGAVITTKTVD